MIYCSQAVLSSPPAASQTSSSWGSWRSWSSPTARAPARSWSDTWERTSPPPLWWSEPVCHVSRVTSEHVPNVTWRRCEIFNRKKWSRHCWFGPLWLQPERETKQFGSFKATEIQYSFWNNISLNLSPCFLRNKTYINKIIYSAIIL